MGRDSEHQPQDFSEAVASGSRGSTSRNHANYVRPKGKASDGAAEETIADFEEEEKETGRMEGDGEAEQEEFEAVEPEEEEGRRPKAVTDPPQPSALEVAEHELTHWPFRSWCPDCVMGRGRDAPHRAVRADERNPMIVGDYGYLSGKDRAAAERAGMTPMIVMRETRSGATLSMMVPSKGDGVGWVNRRVAAWVDRLGHPKIIARADGEPAIKALMRAIRRCREEGSQTVIEESPPGDSKANGAAERAVGETKGMIRTLRSALDRKLGSPLPETHPIFLFLVEYAGVLLSRHKVWNNGKTSYEHIKGKRSSAAVCEFGEQVLFLPAKTVTHRAWRRGTYLGILRDSNEYIVAGSDGAAVRARTLRRMRPDNRWSREAIDGIKGTPWAPVNGAKEEEVPTVHIPREVHREDVPEPPMPKAPQIRRMKIPREAYLRFGRAGCKGCLALRTGRLGGQHDSECVKQVEVSLRESDPKWADKISKAHEEQSYKLARRLEEQEDDVRKRAKTMGAEGPTAGPGIAASDGPDKEDDSMGAALASTGGELSQNTGGAASSSSSGGGRPRPEDSGDQMKDDESSEQNVKRQRLQLLDTTGMSMRRVQDRETLWGAIGGGVDTIMNVEDEPMAQEEQGQEAMRVANACYKDINEEMAKKGGKFIHIHRKLKNDTMGISGAYSHRMNNGCCVTSNAEKFVRKAGRIDKKDPAGKLLDCEVAEEIKKFVLEQHGLQAERHRQYKGIINDDFDLKKLSTCKNVKDICTMVHDSDQAWDDVRGGWLPLEEVKKARLEEMQYVKKAPLYRKVSRSVPQSKGQPIIPVKWVDTNKGTAEQPEYRSRVVAMEIKRGNEDKSVDHELFAEMPPIEALRMVISHAATLGKNGEARHLLVADVRRAYFCAKARRPIYIEIPMEDLEEGDEGRCGELIQSMYGTRDAARNWSEEMRRALISLGAKPGLGSGCVYSLERNGRVTKIMVHGDDIVCAGTAEDLKFIEEQIKQRFDIKTQSVGLSQGFERRAKVLNRIVRVDEFGYTLEADPRHARLIIEELGMERASGTSTPIDDQTRDGATEGELLSAGEAKLYRGMAARLNYLSIDRPDLRVPAQYASRHMSTPSTGAWRIIRKAARYLISNPTWRARYKWQQEEEKIMCFSDADWASDKSTRQSISGGIIFIGTHFVKAWSKSQKAIALSSMESELYAGVLTAIEGKGVQSLMRDMGDPRELTLLLDSSATLAFVQREGFSRTKHVETQWLWIQRQIREGKIAGKKVDGVRNPADLMTKPLAGSRIKLLLNLSQFEQVSGTS